MALYDLVIESMNPCGGRKYADRKITEVETEDPEAYVKSVALYPVIEKQILENGDVLIAAGNGKYRTEYTFSL